jgi:hypothetical protein
MAFYWNNVPEKSGIFNPSDMGDYPILASPMYARFTVIFLNIKVGSVKTQILIRIHIFE